MLQGYVHRIIELPASPTHIDVNSDQKLLSVVFNVNDTPILQIFSIESFFTAVSTACNGVNGEKNVDKIITYVYSEYSENQRCAIINGTRKQCE